MYNQPRVCVIVPAYNEAETIQRVICSIRDNCPDADIVVINDGSHDRTSELARSTGVAVLDLPVNLGIGGAVQTGLKFAARAGYDIAMQIDGDGQHDPKFIGRLLKPILRDEADIVIGSRFLKRIGYKASILRLSGIRFFAFLIGQVTNRRVYDPTSGYRAYNREALLFAARHYPSNFPEPESIVTFLRNKFRIVEVPVAMRDRSAGVSALRPAKFRSWYFVLANSIAIILAGIKSRYR